jgi:hypothetical protein
VAHRGIRSRLLARQRAVGDSGKVFAFEPWPTNITDCLAHVRMNRMANVVVVPEAVATTRELMSFVRANPVARAAPLRPTLRCAWRALPSTICLRPTAVDVGGGESQAPEGKRNPLREHATTWFVAFTGPIRSRHTCACSRMPATPVRR